MPTVSLADHLTRRPAVHQLCSGAYLQEHVWLSEDLLVVPLKPMSLDFAAHYVARYTSEVAHAPVDARGLKHLTNQGKDASPVVAICRYFKVDAPAESLDAIAEKDFHLARRIVGWMATTDATPFGQLTLTITESLFKLMAPNSRKHTRLGFGNTGVAFHSQVSQVLQAARSDERFAFGLSLYDDALREENLLFRVARFFNCLECLAARLKSEAEGSRDAVKKLLRLDDKTRMEVAIGDVRYRFDPIAIGGRIRSKLFHGSMFREGALNAEAKHVYQLLTDSPEILAQTLQDYCELEISRWANGTSLGLEKR